jgi:hypothetical protein
MFRARTLGLVTGAAWLLLGSGLGCTAVLGIDKDYYLSYGGQGGSVTTTTSAGGGGHGATGGTTPTGGAGGGLADGAPCTAPEQCQGNECVDGVCCDAACGGTCEACTEALTGQPDGQCSPTPAGEDPDNECTQNESCSGHGDCRSVDGQTCTQDTDCLSGNCPQSVCCDTSCSTDCRSCDAQYTGLAAGTCGPVNEGMDPYDQCTNPATCNGSGSCN